ncbi:hypothetical protein HK098_000846 [Nowakowskiella sp. JEL0407]|nr:hypothetical protein HK098_000846 [Nowakowskiella sp. JEL0407]
MSETYQGAKQGMSEMGKGMRESMTNQPQSTQPNTGTVSQAAEKGAEDARSAIGSAQAGIQQRTGMMSEAFAKGQEMGAHNVQSGVQAVSAGLGSLTEGAAEIVKEASSGVLGALGMGKTEPKK